MPGELPPPRTPSPGAPKTPLRPGGCAPGPLLSSKNFISKRKKSEKSTFRRNQCVFGKNLVFPCKNRPWEVLVAIFGIYVKNAAQRWGRELCSFSVALFPSNFCWNLGRKTTAKARRARVSRNLEETTSFQTLGFLSKGFLSVALTVIRAFLFPSLQ